jgi:hypothetical protein
MHAKAGGAATPEASFGSLRSSVSTTGTMTTCRSSSAESSRCTSSPAAPSRKATHVLVSAAITDQPATANVRLKRTLPRRRRRRAYVRDVATSFSPVRTVWVIPAPLARCAFSRRSTGTSTVILRAVSTISLLYHSSVPILESWPDLFERPMKTTTEIDVEVLIGHGVWVVDCRHLLP